MASGLAGLLVNTALETWYWRRPYSVVGAVGVLPPGLVPSFEQSQVVSYLVAGYGIMLPLVITALAKHRKPYVASTMLALLLAGVSPLIAPYSSTTTWYRFLIGAAPLASTLAAIGLVEAVKDGRAIMIYLVIASLPGLSFAYGYNWSYDYYKSLREFPSILAPSLADNRLIETMWFFQNNSFMLDDGVVVAHPDYARYVHLAVRNPDPSRFIWAWNGVANETLCRILNYTEARSVILVVHRENSFNTTYYTCLEYLEPISEKLSWIYVGKISRNMVQNQAVREAPGEP